jgi:quinol monooxygenase YgiN
MSDAIVFISHNQIKPGKFDALKAYAPRVAEAIDRDKPGTVVFLMYADPEGTRASIFHVFPDGDAMQRHLEGSMRERLKRSSTSRPRATRSTVHPTSRHSR